jgi:CO/xanthine dehydrogenase FAD-binding subunit
VYTRPDNIEEAIRAVSCGDALVVCGGTDVFPAHVGRPISRPVIDLSAIAALRGIERNAGQIRIGGATTWSSVIAAHLPQAFDGLKAAAREVGSVQIQNRGTVGGNLCNASPAADGVPALLALDAEIELVSLRGRRILPLTSFITGYRRTALASDEILAAVIVPEPSPQTRSSFVKLGARRYLVISILMASAVVELGRDGRIKRASVAIGAASPVAQRLELLERALAGHDLSVPPSSIVRPHHFDGLAPIDDVRASAAYRLEAALTVVGEALDRAAGVHAIG